MLNLRLERVLSLFCLIIILCYASHASALSYEIVQPENYGTIAEWVFPHGATRIDFESTNSENPPYMNGLSVQSKESRPSYDKRSYVEYDISLFDPLAENYLVFSPWSVYAGSPTTETIEIYSYSGDGLATLDDFDLGIFAGTASITEPGSPWYEPNEYGGFQGDTYFDISNILLDYRSTSATHIGFNLRNVGIANEYTGVLFRTPTAIALPAPPSPNPPQCSSSEPAWQGWLA